MQCSHEGSYVRAGCPVTLAAQSTKSRLRQEDDSPCVNYGFQGTIIPLGLICLLSIDCSPIPPTRIKWHILLNIWYISSKIYGVYFILRPPIPTFLWSRHVTREERLLAITTQWGTTASPVQKTCYWMSPSHAGDTEFLKYFTSWDLSSLGLLARASGTGNRDNWLLQALVPPLNIVQLGMTSLWISLH
jgi:hypothetical protein